MTWLFSRPLNIKYNFCFTKPTFLKLASEFLTFSSFSNFLTNIRIQLFHNHTVVSRHLKKDFRTIENCGSSDRQLMKRSHLIRYKLQSNRAWEKKQGCYRTRVCWRLSIPSKQIQRKKQLYIGQWTNDSTL